MALDSWDASSNTMTFAISLGRALLASVPSPGYIFSITVANGATTQQAPGLEIGPAAGAYSGVPLPMTLPPNVDETRTPLLIRMWSTLRLTQSTAMPEALNVFNLTLQPTATLAAGTVVVISGANGVAPSDPNASPPDWAAAGTFGVSLSYSAGKGILGSAAALDPVGNTLTFNVGSLWTAGVKTIVLFTLSNSAVPQLPTSATIATTAPAGSSPNAPPPILEPSDPFEPEQCEQRPFFINSVYILAGRDGSVEDSRLRCIIWDPTVGRLTALFVNQTTYFSQSTASDTDLNAFADVTAFRLPLKNGGFAQPARTVTVGIVLPYGQSPPVATVAAVNNGNGGPLQIRIWQIAAAAQISSIPGGRNSLALSLAPEVDLSPGSIVAIAGLVGTAAYFPDSLQVLSKPHYPK